MTTAAAGGQGNTETATTTKTETATKTETPAKVETTTTTETPAKVEKTETPAAGKTETATETTTKTETATGAKVEPDFSKLVIPEAGKTFVDKLTIDTVIEQAKASGWSLEDAQNAVNEHADMLARADAAFLSQLKADPDYGGDKLADTQKLARSVIDLVRPEGHARRDAFLQTLNRVAGGNNPEFVSFLADLGKMAAEDSFGSQATATRGQPRDAATVLYGEEKK